MSSQKKDAAAPAQDSIQEIDDIMSEIEELQQTMSASQQAPAVAAKAAAVAEAVEVPVHDEAEPNVMQEFQGASGDVSMEETLADLKDDEPSGPNLIDQHMEAEAREREAASAEVETVVEEAPTEIVAEATPEAASEDELLDEIEAEALEEAIASEEEAALQEEIPVVAAAPRRGRSSPAPTPLPRRGGKSHSQSASDACVAIQLQGDMTLKLSYEFDGQDVTIGFVDGALHVELSDGTEFKIPVRRNPLRKAA